MEIISMKKSINFIYPYITIFNKNTKPLSYAVSKEHQSYQIARQITVPPYMQPSVFALFYGSGLMTVNTHCNVVESRCFMTARGKMNILQGPFYIFAILTAILINFSMFLTVCYVSSVATCVILAKGDELHL